MNAHDPICSIVPRPVTFDSRLDRLRAEIGALMVGDLAPADAAFLDRLKDCFRLRQLAKEGRISSDYETERTAEELQAIAERFAEAFDAVGDLFDCGLDGSAHDVVGDHFHDMLRPALFIRDAEPYEPSYAAE